MNEEYFEVAFLYAIKAAFFDEVPVGAIIVYNDEIIGYGYNYKEHKRSVLEHAELRAIKMAQKKLHNWRLDGCDMYVTLDPCPMCASAIKQSRISNVYSALINRDKRQSDILKLIFKADSTNPEVNFITNIFPSYSQKILNDFFKKQRF